MANVIISKRLIMYLFTLLTKYGTLNKFMYNKLLLIVLVIMIIEICESNE